MPLATARKVEALRADFHRIPELLAMGAPEQPATVEEIPEPEEEPEPPPASMEPEPAAQLGLF